MNGFSPHQFSHSLSEEWASPHSVVDHDEICGTAVVNMGILIE
ncbi:hypothetical protein SAMN06273570_5026 [Candidatus Pantoea floridensis]|uniref:Uncharacterized protein n=1 Tax=Candidatus Pantoea floridensis TaxID=1938870 RepID=A0A286DRC0_9GAMM|nr:hypothetical protein BX596_5017 [Enterobacteriaceae bacterium JKS000233]SOD61210.1 hypothetical protein SAMN06273570_5026 [Pantoea floridensis]